MRGGQPGWGSPRRGERAPPPTTSGLPFPPGHGPLGPRTRLPLPPPPPTRAAPPPPAQAARLVLVQILINAKGLNMNPIQSLYYVSPACFLCLCVPFGERGSGRGRGVKGAGGNGGGGARERASGLPLPSPPPFAAVVAVPPARRCACAHHLACLPRCVGAGASLCVAGAPPTPPAPPLVTIPRHAPPYTHARSAGRGARLPGRPPPDLPICLHRQRTSRLCAQPGAGQA